MRCPSPQPSLSPTTTRRIGKTPETGLRSNLASRACDACRARRRKCHFDSRLHRGDAGSQSKPQCRDCARLGIPCNFLVPTRPRGPKRRKILTTVVNRNDSERLDQPENPVSEKSPSQPALNHEPVLMEPEGTTPLSTTSQVRSPNEASLNPINGLSPRITNVVQTQSPSISRPGFRTDELCSRALINIMMADYLDLIYPLVPVVHRPSFRHDLANNRDVSDPDFFALLMSLVALTVGLLPSRFEVYRAVDPEAGMRFETRTAFINCCAEMCTRLRDASYWDQINLRKWAVCYVLSVACFQTGQVNRSRMFDVEFLQLARLLGLHQLSEYEGLNCIETQLRKKAFWLLFYSHAHTKFQSGRWERLRYLDPSEMREIDFEALMPLDVDDEQIFETSVLGPIVAPMASAETPRNTHQGTQTPFTLASGFILHSRVFFKGLQEAMSNVGCECELHRSPAVRVSRLRDLLQDMRYMLDDAPGPLRQWASPESCDAPVTPRYDDEGRTTLSSYDSPTGHSCATLAGNEGFSKIIKGQAEAMRGNIHVTHLWLQSRLLDQVDAILQQEIAIGAGSAADGDDPSAALKANWAEREDVCRQMLHLLHSVPYTYMEPNGLYLTYKVRDVAAALLNCPFEAHERPAKRAAEYMRDFARALSRFDRSEIFNANCLKSWVDEDREMNLGRARAWRSQIGGGSLPSGSAS